MAELSVQKITSDGITPTYSACDAAGDTFVNDGDTFIYVKNGDTVDHIVTVTAERKCNFGFLHDLSVTIPAGGEKIIGPFLPDRFNTEAEKAVLSYDAVTSMTIAVLK